MDEWIEAILLNFVSKIKLDWLLIGAGTLHSPAVRHDYRTAALKNALLFRNGLVLLSR